MPKIPSLMEMLKAGVHFGHKKSKRDPRMQSYIYTTRSDINIIDLNQTVEKLEKVLAEAKKFGQAGKTVLFVGTKKQAQKSIRKYAVNAEMPYIISRWIGGTFTNFSVFKKNIKKYKDLKEKMAKGELDKYTKKERLQFQKEIKKLEEMVGGLVTMDKLPDAVFVVDTKKDKIAISEAVKMGIPVMAICDTNCNPEKLDWVIPANDDASKSIDMVARLVSEAIKEGKETPLPVEVKKVEKGEAGEK
ncbi:30S ribosomal protein S2 [Candidatus Falkowbacteria bacterium RBG_13_39_14]|uniref:Small ribosomal subunit protein uS2 n=1 Tax=Candidatus Falkowbacteria bacterium RBG_13_39_14 TaxID=1797985 RepID=A0A1F5S5E9_9BACT|nr:MAG: 30S ribosomal protein S2 [Candidatus Falkowbacteria bacterium RBG_13_39_14]